MAGKKTTIPEDEQRFHTPLALLRDFFTLQEERVHTYQRFDQYLKDYLSTHDGSEYKRHVANTTSAFQSLSEEINEIITELQSKNRDAEAALIRAIQEQERLKLAQTVHMHQLKIAGVRTPEQERDMHEVVVALGATIDEINDSLAELLEYRRAEEARAPPPPVRRLDDDEER